MDIQYIGHSSFRLKGKEGTVITDPFGSSVGFPFPATKADMVTVSHDHGDHNNILAVKPTAQRDKVFVIRNAGEFEVSNISVYGYHSWHDDAKGVERGSNIMFSIFLDGVHVLHLGDLGHTLTETMLQGIPEVDVLLCPVGGHFTISPKQASEVIATLEPSVIIPMHYRTPEHDQATFGEVATLEDFCKEYGKTVEPVEKFTYTKKAAIEETETQLVILQPRTSGE